MTLILTALSLGLVLVNIAGVTILASRWISSFAIARAVGLIAIVITMFFLEHFVGFGRLAWAWPFTTLIAVIALFRTRAQLNQLGFWRAEIVFLTGVSYGLLWRMSFPSIVPSSERLTNLYFIQSYLNGDRLPPPDLWFPPLHFDFYYALQHYAAALLGRIFDVSAGMSYNLAFCVLLALPIALSWDLVSRFLKDRWHKVLLVMTLVIGGTGATPFVHLIYEPSAETPVAWEVNDRTWGGARFVGSFDQKANTPLGISLFKPVAPIEDSAQKPQELPTENYGYQFALGDYHPPAGGFFLLILALALIGALESARGNETQVFTIALGLTVPLQIATNAWVFPLQGILVLAWAGWRSVVGRPPDWAALLGGGALGGVMLYPFLGYFSQQPTGSSIRWIETGDHTPWPQFIAALWPVLLFIVLGLWRHEWRRLTLALALGCLAILLLSELVYVDDPMVDPYERTNTTMKWWGYLNTLTLAGLGTLLLSSSSKFVRSSVIVTCFALNLHAYDLYRYWSTTPKTEFGQLQGDGVYMRDAVTRDMLTYLRDAPPGIVLESLACGSFCDSGIYALFSEKPLLLGWPMHIMTWRMNVSSMWIRKNEIDQFYRGEQDDPIGWLDTNDVRYIVWAKGDAANLSAWLAINASLAGRYGWREFGNVEGKPIGLWARADTP